MVSTRRVSDKHGLPTDPESPANETFDASADADTAAPAKMSREMRKLMIDANPSLGGQASLKRKRASTSSVPAIAIFVSPPTPPKSQSDVSSHGSPRDEAQPAIQSSGRPGIAGPEQEVGVHDTVDDHRPVKRVRIDEGTPLPSPPLVHDALAQDQAHSTLQGTPSRNWAQDAAHGGPFNDWLARRGDGDANGLHSVDGPRQHGSSPPVSPTSQAFCRENLDPSLPADDGTRQRIKRRIDDYFRSGDEHDMTKHSSIPDTPDMGLEHELDWRDVHTPNVHSRQPPSADAGQLVISAPLAMENVQLATNVLDNADVAAAAEQVDSSDQMMKEAVDVVTTLAAIEQAAAPLDMATEAADANLHDATSTPPSAPDDPHAPSLPAPAPPDEPSSTSTTVSSALPSAAPPPPPAPPKNKKVSREMRRLQIDANPALAGPAAPTPSTSASSPDHASATAAADSQPHPTKRVRASRASTLHNPPNYTLSRHATTEHAHANKPDGASKKQRAAQGLRGGTSKDKRAGSTPKISVPFPPPAWLVDRVLANVAAAAGDWHTVQALYPRAEDAVRAVRRRDRGGVGHGTGLGHGAAVGIVGGEEVDEKEERVRRELAVMMEWDLGSEAEGAGGGKSDGDVDVDGDGLERATELGLS